MSSSSQQKYSISEDQTGNDTLFPGARNALARTTQAFVDPESPNVREMADSKWELNSDSSTNIHGFPLSAATRIQVVALAGLPFSVRSSSDSSTGWGDVFP